MAQPSISSLRTRLNSLEISFVHDASMASILVLSCIDKTPYIKMKSIIEVMNNTRKHILSYIQQSPLDLSAFEFFLRVFRSNGNVKVKLKAL
ncbi:hypothetical protein OUZ56_009383 [Daphnia magna]|uniref:Uncharacterized protein n=1 Tax=Daphnia magna TaxID=35525 RepID=A0ABR0AFU1_9CRUS|nr:hypothetical protein OUZ56_009383 [Daphnia magna]